MWQVVELCSRAALFATSELYSTAAAARALGREHIDQAPTALVDADAHSHGMHRDCALCLQAR